MDLVDVHVEIAGARSHLLAHLGADILRALLPFVGVVADPLHHGDHEVLDLALLVGLSALEPVRRRQVTAPPGVVPEWDGLDPAVERHSPPPVAKHHARGVDVLPDDRELLRRVDYSGHQILRLSHRLSSSSGEAGVSRACPPSMRARAAASASSSSRAAGA